MCMIPMDPGVKSVLLKLAPAFAQYDKVRTMGERRGNIVCVNEEIVVKRGEHVLREAEAIKHVAENTSIPLPKLYGAHTEDNLTYMVSEFIPGETLWHTWSKLSDVDKDALAQSLKAYVDQLRGLSANYIGSIGNKPVLCDLLLGSSAQGPFNSQHEFHNFLVGLYKDEKPLSHFDSILRKLLHDQYRVVFSHGDLNPGNIIIREGCIVGIIDWEMAGFFPEYWEYSRVCLGLHWSNSRLPDYITFVQKCIKPYPNEAWVIRIIDSSWIRIN